MVHLGYESRRFTFVGIFLFVIGVLSTSTCVVVATEVSNFERLCIREGAIDDASFAFPDVDNDLVMTRNVGSIASPRGHNVSYAYTRYVPPKEEIFTHDCVIISATSLSGHATHTAQWLESLSADTGCGVAVLEYRGFGLSKQRDSPHRTGMKIASLAGDFHDLVTHFETHHEHIFLFGLSAGANVLWAWLQFHWTPKIASKVKGILPLDGGLLVTPQLRAAAASFDVAASRSAFSWADMQTMTDRFLSAIDPVQCFEELHTFFTQNGFFSSAHLAERYLRGICDLDCVAFGLLNKDSLLADYTDAVVENAARFKIPVFTFIAEDSIVPTTTQEFVADHSIAIPGSERWVLSTSKGGIHFALMPGERGRGQLVGAMSAFILRLLRAKNVKKGHGRRSVEL